MAIKDKNIKKISIAKRLSLHSFLNFVKFYVGKKGLFRKRYPAGSYERAFWFTEVLSIFTVAWKKPTTMKGYIE